MPLEINVGLKSRDDNGEFTNVIKGYAIRGRGGLPVSARPPVGVGPGARRPGSGHGGRGPSGPRPRRGVEWNGGGRSVQGENHIWPARGPPDQPRSRE